MRIFFSPKTVIKRDYPIIISMNKNYSGQFIIITTSNDILERKLPVSYIYVSLLKLEGSIKGHYL